jgi:hypothetical protein
MLAGMVVGVLATLTREVLPMTRSLARDKVP